MHATILLRGWYLSTCSIIRRFHAERAKVINSRTLKSHETLLVCYAPMTLFVIREIL